MAKRKYKIVEKPLPTSSVVMAFPQPPPKNAEEYLKAYTGYAFTAISAIAQEIASIDLKLFQVKYVKGQPESTPVLEHESLSLLQYVNPLTTFYDQIEATQVYLELTGEAFWVVLRKEGNGTPQEVWLVRPDWMKIVPSAEDIIDHYVYNPGGISTDKVKFPKENVIHFKYFNPLNPYRGKGSIQAAALPLDIHTFAQEWNRNFFFNSAIPSMIFTTEKKLNEATIKRFMNQWQQSYGGRAKSNKVAFLGGGMKVDTATMGAKEMDFEKQQKMMRDDVLAVFKVPRSILGITDDVNRANAEATIRAFMERVVTPRMRKFAGCLNEFFLPMYGDTTNLFFDFVDPAPEDVELKLKKYENAIKYAWMTPNEVRAEENLEPMPGGDILLPLALAAARSGMLPESEQEGESILSKIFGKKELKKVKRPEKSKKPFKHMMRIPVKRLEVVEREKLEKSLTKDLTKMIGKMLKIKSDEDLEEELDKERKEKRKEKPLFGEEERDAHWSQFIEFVDNREAQLKEKTIQLLEDQEALIIERLEKVKHWKKDLRKGKESSILLSIADMIKTWIPVIIPIIRETVINQGNHTLEFLGVGGTIDITTDMAVEFLRIHGVDLVTAINETTREELRKTLAEGFEKKEGVPMLRKRVEKVYKKATTVRAMMIARTEAIRASNFATVEAYRQSEVVKAEEWLTSRDPDVCPFCEEMEGKIIDLDENYFDVGDSLTVNGNTLTFNVIEVGYPPLHPNCRCTTMPVLIDT